MNRQHYSAQMGFSLIEMIIVVLIVAIISIVAAPKWIGGGQNLNYEAIHLLHDIRYAQALSMTTGLRYRWVKVSGNSYQIQNSSSVAITMPSGSTTVTFSGNIAFGTLVNLPNNLIEFDAQGIPYTDSSTALAATAAIPISGGGTSRTVQITPQTGYGVLQ